MNYKMKAYLAAALVVSISEQVPAQSMAQRSAASKIPVTLSCVRASSGGAKNITWSTSYGSGTRENTRTLTFDCAVRWGGKWATNAVLDVWFVGTPATGGKDIVLDNKRFDLQLTPSSNCLTRVTSKEVEHVKTDYVALGIKEREGAKLRGCVAQLLIDGCVVRAYSSLAHLQQAAWTTPFGEVQGPDGGE